MPSPKMTNTFEQTLFDCWSNLLYFQLLLPFNSSCLKTGGRQSSLVCTAFSLGRFSQKETSVEKVGIERGTLQERVLPGRGEGERVGKDQQGKGGGRGELEGTPQRVQGWPRSTATTDSAKQQSPSRVKCDGNNNKHLKVALKITFKMSS